MLYKDTNSNQFVYAYAHNSSGDPLTGLAVTGAVSKDGQSATALTNASATEIGGGVYAFTITSDEVKGDALAFIFSCESAGVIVEPFFCHTRYVDTPAYVVSIASNAITAASIASNAITDAKVASDVTIFDVATKTGYKLASDGLDSIPITAPSGVATTFREMVVQVWRRFFKKVIKTSDTITTYADNGTSGITSQAISATTAAQTQGAATSVPAEPN